ATFVHPNHIVCLCSWGLTHLPPTCNSKLFGDILRSCPELFYPSRHALMLLSAHDESSSMSALCLLSTTPTKLKR
ncbi:hypothetical protein CHN45_09840, partial [Vibrio cholerae]